MNFARRNKLTPKQFQEIKEKIEIAKDKKSRAEGAKAKLEEQIKKEYDMDFDEVEDKIKDLEAEIESDKESLNIMYDKLEKIVDWGNLE